MSDEKDRYGDKLRDLEKAREDQWAYESDHRLIEKMRMRLSDTKLLCPRCGEPLIERTISGVKALACPKEEGAWLDDMTLERLVQTHSHK
ncbi:MAG: zf-TFIIB domain-containing protein [Candidatus Binataceae bacterium]